jgi:hypothetical protein
VHAREDEVAVVCWRSALGQARYSSSLLCLALQSGVRCPCYLCVRGVWFVGEKLGSRQGKKNAAAFDRQREMESHLPLARVTLTKRGGTQ